MNTRQKIELGLRMASRLTQHDDLLRKHKPANRYLLPTAQFSEQIRQELQYQRIIADGN